MKVAACVLAALLAGGCASKPPAPVVDRSENRAAPMMITGDKYRVRRGDTLHAIAFQLGLDYRDIAGWNGIRPPYVIYPDQLLHLAPLPASAVPGRPSVASSDKKPAAGGSTGGSAARAEVAEKPPATAGDTQPPPRSTAPKAQPVSGGPKNWLWPVKGRLRSSFAPGDPARNGLDIAGSEGQDVVATAGGAVVYSGNGLIGYGELIIIKHSDRMLSAYAHNRVRLTQEGELVSAGQKIAEMGRNDRNEQLLHFEIRVNGKPVNPLNYLPRQ